MSLRKRRTLVLLAWHGTFIGIALLGIVLGDLLTREGLLTLIGSATGHGEHDAVTMFRLLKTQGNFILARPKVVEVPLNLVGTGFLRRNQRPWRLAPAGRS